MQYTTILTLFIQTLVSLQASACPAPCHCSDTQMTCENVVFTELDLIGLDIPPDVRHVVLRGNSLESISPNSMLKFRHLESLEISKNAITKIPPGTFRGFSSLTKLVMNENEIQELERGSFRGLHSLRHFEMQFNKIAHLQSGVFDEAPEIAFIRLDDNKLRTINDGVFTPLRSLRRLFLTRNEIITIQGAAFRNMKMQFLGMSSNRIRTVPPSAFEGFTVSQRFLLLANPLDCSCRNAMSYKVNFMDLKILGYCESPNQVRGKSVSKAHEELLECTMCDLDPCRNQGQCSGDKESYTCTCAERFTGKQCQKDVCAGYKPERPSVVVPVVTGGEIDENPYITPESVAYKQHNTTKYVVVKEQVPNEDDQNKLKILYAMCAFEFIVIVCFVVYFTWKRYEEWKLQKQYSNDKNRAILFSIKSSVGGNAPAGIGAIVGSKGGLSATPASVTNNGSSAAISLYQQQQQPLLATDTASTVVVEENAEFPADLKHMIMTGSVQV